MSERVTCPGCNGEKGGPAFVDGYRNGKAFGELRYVACFTCKGEGTITPEHADRIDWGRRVMDARRELEITGTEFANGLGIDRVRYSHLEQGSDEPTEAERRAIEQALFGGAAPSAEGR